MCSTVWKDVLSHANSKVANSRIRRRRRSKRQTMKCGICGEESEPATPLFDKMCSNCYRLFRDVIFAGCPLVEILSDYHEENREAKEIWFAHLKKGEVDGQKKRKAKKMSSKRLKLWLWHQGLKDYYRRSKR